jgi:hypothetical protein
MGEQITIITVRHRRLTTDLKPHLQWLAPLMRLSEKHIHHIFK